MEPIPTKPTTQQNLSTSQSHWIGAEDKQNSESAHCKSLNSYFALVEIALAIEFDAYIQFLYVRESSPSYNLITWGKNLPLGEATTSCAYLGNLRENITELG